MQDIILLHGALGSKDQFEELIPLLNDTYAVHTFNFDGHGGEKPLEVFSVEHFSQNLVDYVREHQLHEPLIFGYSMGGYVALYSAAQFPDLFGEVITLGTKFDWTPEAAEQEVQMLDPDLIEAKIPPFAEYLKTLHAPFDWKAVMRQTADLMLRLGENPLLTEDILRQIAIEVALNRGEEDMMITEEETLQVKNVIRQSNYRSIPNCPHPIQKIAPEKLREVIENPKKS